MNILSLTKAGDLFDQSSAEEDLAVRLSEFEQLLEQAEEDHAAPPADDLAYAICRESRFSLNALHQWIYESDFDQEAVKRAVGLFRRAEAALRSDRLRGAKMAEAFGRSVSTRRGFVEKLNDSGMAGFENEIESFADSDSELSDVVAQIKELRRSEAG